MQRILRIVAILSGLVELVESAVLPFGTVMAVKTQVLL
jgi:hypothetical protein